ncbi:MAG: FmdE family protein [Desulfobacterales bacterium]|nr:FmdE family protein [Desulfobacterales bacterium]MDD4072398.1 FmdE family protein [Desulfobacterales bacterium]MDD4393300.1 FmdE family protein [Desulfobacterales bacterium]
MNQKNNDEFRLPKALVRCIAFHGHVCPGLVYGYRVAAEAMRLLGVCRSTDEEIVAVCENDSCAVDAFQVLLGTTAGKGNLIIKDYGKNAYTIFHRSGKKAYRFFRNTGYRYSGPDKEEFDRLDRAMSDQTADRRQLSRLKKLKARDLLTRPFEEVFSVRQAAYAPPPYARMAPSCACSRCGEMTMMTRMIDLKDGSRVCIPCSEQRHMD